MSLLRLAHSPLVDEAWHAHILCTKDYRKFCDDVFGEFLDHTPGTEGFNLARRAVSVVQSAFFLFESIDRRF